MRSRVPGPAPKKKSRKSESDVALYSGLPQPTTLTFSQEDAQKYFPPGFTVNVDRKAWRFQVKHRAAGSISRSWHAYGEIVALSMTCNWAWEWHRYFTGTEQPNPHVWMREFAWKA